MLTFSRNSCAKKWALKNAGGGGKNSLLENFQHFYFFYSWQGASDEQSFPTLGGGKAASSVSSAPIAWGPRR